MAAAGACVCDCIHTHSVSPTNVRPLTGLVPPGKACYTQSLATHQHKADLSPLHWLFMCSSLPTNTNPPPGTMGPTHHSCLDCQNFNSNAFCCFEIAQDNLLPNNPKGPLLFIWFLYWPPPKGLRAKIRKRNLLLLLFFKKLPLPHTVTWKKCTLIS